MRDEPANDNLGDAAAIPPPPANVQTAVTEGKLPPELLEWALEHINEEEIIAGLEEIQKTGGLQLSEFIQELEQMVAARD